MERMRDSFRSLTPISRFDYHTLPQGSSASRAILYAGSSVRGCLVEVFGDTRVVDVGFWMIAKMTSKRELQLLDLRGGNAMKAGTVAASARTAIEPTAKNGPATFTKITFI